MSAQALDGPELEERGLRAELLTADALVALALEPGGDAEALAALATGARGDRLRIALLALADPRPLSSTLDEALAAHVRLLVALGGLCSASVWRLGPGLRPQVAVAAGPAPPAVSSAAIARIAAGGLDREPAVLVRAFEEPCALLTWVHGERESQRARLLAERSALLLGAAFERAQALDGTSPQTLRSSERRLTRVALDLHDGPLQDIALLRGELSALRRALAADPGRGSSDPLSRVDDLQAIAEAAEADLRELAISLESTSLVRRPLADAVRGLARAFALRSGIEPTVVIEGAGDELSAAERGVLLRVIGEALNNVRAHAAAARVEVELRVGPSDVEASVSDDGSGFDVELRVPEAVRGGRLGVIGMVERVRQMGGGCQVASAPGDGTRVSLRLPRSLPEAGEQARRAAG